MRSRARSFGRGVARGLDRVGAFYVAVWRAVASEVGRDELCVAVGLTLITWALWSRLGELALLVPGVVLVWIYLPARVPFVMRPAEPKTRRTDG